MADSESRTVTGQRTVSRFYRRPPGFGWLLALAAIPLLLAAIGFGPLKVSKPDINGPNLTAPSIGLPTVPTVKVPGLSFAPLSILRKGADVVLSGDLPDLNVKTALLDRLRGIFGPSVSLVDQLNIKPGVAVPDFAGLSAVLKAAAGLPDFRFNLSGDTITLTGTANSDAESAAIESAAIDAWPDLNIVNEIEVRGPAPGPTNTGVSCDNLQATITDLMGAPITFVTDGFSLSAQSQQQLAPVAEQVKGCADARIAVNGYTDNTGNDGINVPLSNNRAKSVADYLVSQGVPADHVTAKGFGSADPVAGNDTSDGRAQNRRVVIMVS